MKTEKPMISIIMPVYKVEEYVSRAIESIQNQTFEAWELWTVDDGSPDKSGEICDEYAKRDSRIHVIHKENGGAPSARNAAMKLAEGKYFYFMDSDDWAESNMLEDMFNLAEKHQSQLVVAAFYIDTYYSDTEKYSEKKYNRSCVFMNQQEFRKNAYQLFDKNLLYTPWNKLYLAEYLKENKIEFPALHWDDFPFNLSVIKDIEKVCVTDEAYYHFLRKRQESESEKYNPKLYEKREEEHGWLKALYRYWDVDDRESREFVSRRYVERLIGCVENLTNPRCTLNETEKRAEIKKMIFAENCSEALRYAKPHTAMMWGMLLPFKLKSVWFTYSEGCVISRVKATNTKLFARLKAKR